MWRVVSGEIWQDKISGLQLPFYYQWSFIESISNIFDVEVSYYINTIKGQDNAYYICYNKNGRVSNLEPFSYTPFYIRDGIAEPVIFEVVESLVHILKAKFKTIHFKLEPQLKDIRPLIWHNFKAEIRYTHVKSDFFTVHPQVNKNLKKINESKYKIAIKTFSEEGLKLILDFQRKFGFKKAECDNYKILLEALSKKSLIRFFEVYDAASKRLICSRIVLIDSLTSRLYLLMISDTHSDDKYIHTYMHFIVLNWAKENGIKDIDLCGANIKSISIFKSFL